MALKQVFIVNKDLKMGKGKIAVQVAHGEVFYMDTIRDVENLPIIDCGESEMLSKYFDWMRDGLMKKVVLKATQDEMLMLIGALEAVNGCGADDLWFDIVFDKGLTQVPADSMTCIVFEPLDEKEADQRFSYLKLL